MNCPFGSSSGLLFMIKRTEFPIPKGNLLILNFLTGKLSYQFNIGNELSVSGEFNKVLWGKNPF